MLGRRSQRDFEDEIRSHLELEAERLRAQGMSAPDAEYAARRDSLAARLDSGRAKWNWGEYCPDTVVRQAVEGVRRALTLSPMASMASGGGPTHAAPAAATARAKSVFSEKKP
mgnify:CR=1 FL=1